MFHRVHRAFPGGRKASAVYSVFRRIEHCHAKAESLLYDSCPLPCLPVPQDSLRESLLAFPLLHLALHFPFSSPSFRADDWATTLHFLDASLLSALLQPLTASDAPTRSPDSGHEPRESPQGLDAQAMRRCLGALFGEGGGAGGAASDGEEGHGARGEAGGEAGAAGACRRRLTEVREGLREGDGGSGEGHPCVCLSLST